MNPVDILGIDLGTTKSVIAVWDIETGETIVLPNLEGDTITPSVVTFDTATNQPSVGKLAIEQMLTRPHDVIYSVKRFIGRPPDDRWVKLDEQHVTYDVEESQQHTVVIRAGNRRLSPSEVSAEILRKLKNDAEAVLGNYNINHAVISVPAYFNDSQRRATQRAGELAGLTVHRIIPEPTAAALAFGLGEHPETVAVYDLGGGTFDISILRIEHGLFRVKAIGGDTHLGGDDFDQKIVEWLADQFKIQYSSVTLPLDNDLQLRARLREAAKRAKIALTDAEKTSIQLADLLIIDGREYDLDVTLTRQKFEQLIAPLIEQSLQLIEATLRTAGMVATDLSQFLLVGGQTRTPAVKAAISRRFERPINDKVKPEEAVGRGAAILGARLRGHLKERINLWDALPLSLGVEVADGRMDVIIKANEPIPIDKSKLFTNQRDGQEYIRFSIYQGERPIAVNNASVGQVVLPLTTTRRTGEHRINCMFKVDANGILTVKAVSADVEAKPVEVVFTYGTLSAEEIEARKQDAEVHREQDELESRLLELRKQLTDLRNTITNRPPGDPSIQHLAQVEAALENRNPDSAAELITEILKLF